MMIAMGGRLGYNRPLHGKITQGPPRATGFDAPGDTTTRWIAIYHVKNGKWEFIDQQRFAAAK